MYPRLSDILQDLFGITSPVPIYTFGAMVAVAFLAAAWLTGKQLDRLYAAGRIGGVHVAAGEPEKKKKKGRRPATREVSPSALVGTAVIIAVVAGVGGAKLFHILENLGDFARDPLGAVFSTSGLTFYGGLIVAALSIAWYVRKKGLSIAAFADATAPGLMIAYGIGRIGCHLAGDGDWGVQADVAARPSWVPSWLWAETYPNNVLNVDLSQTPVYPTPLYEFLLCAAFFGVLWAVRKHPFKSGWLFSLYLVFTGIERFLIEQIRVNNEFDVLGMTVTQAEVISVLMVVVGLAGLVWTTKKFAAAPKDSHPRVASSAA